MDKKRTERGGNLPEAQAKAADRRTFLNLDDLPIERATVQIHGRTYELRDPEDFGVIEQAKYRNLSDRWQKAWNRLTKSPDDANAAAEADHCFERLVSLLVVDCPEEVIRELPARKKVALLDFFAQVMRERHPAAAVALDRALSQSPST